MKVNPAFQHMPTHLKVRLSRQAEGGRLTWTRIYEEGSLFETVVYEDFNNQTQHVDERRFTNWFRRSDYPSVRKDYIRWGWEILEFNP